MNHFRSLLGRMAFVPLLAAIFSTSSLRASPGEEMADAANNWLNALTPEQQAKATYPFENDERFDWHFIPKERKGLPFKEMTPAQQKLAHALLSTGLSPRGYAKAVTIMSLEDVLKEMEQGKGPERNPERYFFTIFGKPGKDVWGWRVEGHHVSLNFVVRGGEVLAATPAFFGANPAEVKQGPRKGLRVLREEETLGRAFVKSLSPEQRKVAILDIPAPKEMITGNARKAHLLDPPGISADKLTAEQKEALHQLLNSYAQRHRPEVAETDLKKIEQAGFDKVTFAWAGGLEPGDPHYYRIQGPSFLLEYDDTQNNANHIHTVWRDLENDFGDDVLRRHYDEVPHDK
ncbi:MAG TPA: DUF3500 domain-containing protein [Verrucomicrobiae bacterium]|nr:DUF3500 domain-containing protein [Verrucomicrobiae bacterium]